MICKAREALEETARQYHEAKHWLLGEVDRDRFPTFRQCPYTPCIEAHAALAALDEAQEATPAP